MNFEWDENKNKVNIEKHGIDFPYATRVFLDNQRIDLPDIRKDYGEKRHIVFGNIEERVFVVAYTIREHKIRIITARKANDRETKKYHDIQSK